MAYAAAAVEPIARYGWGAVVLTGVLFACGTMASAGALMFGWRFFYPLAPATSHGLHKIEGAQPVTEDPATALKVEGLESQIGAVTDKLESLARSYLSASESQSKRLDLTNSYLSELSGRLSKVEGVLRPQERGLLAQASLMGTDGTRLGAIESRLEMLSADVNKALETIEARLDEQKQSHHLLHDKVWSTFRAKQVLESAMQVLRRLDELGAYLNAPLSNSETGVDWDDWEQQFKTWVGALHHLCTLIKPYRDIEEELLDTPAERYKSQYWSTNFDQKRFPTSDVVHDFKTFRILYQNLDGHKVKIMEAVRHKAFV
jgi:hypothetical protein